MPPSLGSYEEAARSIYEPQKQAETIALGATRDVTKNALESQKGQVNTNYQDAINQLTQAVQDQTGQINQLYSQRLGGNFSGLQGNDLGQMFSRANQQQGIVEQTRANKLNEITTGQTNADITYGAGVAALTPKYQSMETEYAHSAYGSAVKDYQDNQYKQAQLNLSYAKLIQGGQNSANSAATKAQAAYKVTGKKDQYGQDNNSQGYMFTGPNNKPISMAQYISGAGMGGQDIVDLLQNGSSYDRNIAGKISKANPKDDNQLISLIKKYDTGHYYGF